MFSIFKKIFKMTKKQEMEQQVNDAVAVAQRLNTEIKQLREDNDRLIAENNQLKTDFSSAVERVRYLADQVRMLETQIQAKTQYSDNDRNY